jgi:tRNA1(Val) A37 N6-methylase TrmN6
MTASARPTDADAEESQLLGGAVRLMQPVQGYRAGLDAVMLAAACDAPEGARVLDAGCGSGAVLACLAHRRADVHVQGLEIDPGLALLCAQTIALNGLGERAGCGAGDLAERIMDGPFDAVVTNPPFHDGAGEHVSPDARRARSLTEAAGFGLGDWLGACLDRLKPRGGLWCVIRADRLPAAVRALDGRAGAVRLFPLWPRAGVAAKRVIVAARKDVRSPAAVLPGLVLHEADGAYTAAAQAVLRDGQALALDADGPI